MPGTPEWTENRPDARAWGRAELRELARFRELTLLLALRELQLRYKQTFFGVAWAVLQPLIAAVIFTAVFGRLAKLPSDGLPYAVFAYSGLVLWTYLSGAITSSAQSLVENEALVTKVYFPRILAPVASTLPGLVDAVIALLVLAILMVIYGVAPGVQVLLLPLWLALAGVLSLGVGAGLAALNVRYRDVRHALPFLVQTWFFASPIVYPSSLASGAKAWVLGLNPATGLIDGFRWSVVAGSPPTTSDLVSLGTGVLAVVAGLIYFQRHERRFADMV